MKRLKIITALAAFSAAYSDSEYTKESKRKYNNDGTESKRTYGARKQGMQEFSYPDGFTCQALNKKNADKKHAKWTKEK